MKGTRKRRTLNLGDGGCEDVLLRLLVAEALEDGVDDRLDELGLLALLRLLLEADPRVEDGLDLGGERDLLALDERLGLKLRGLLKVPNRMQVSGSPARNRKGVSGRSGVRREETGTGEWSKFARGRSGVGGGEGEERTLESAKRPSVTETTSFICSTDWMRSLTTWVCSARDA